MRHEDHAARVLLQELLEPRDAFRIEMVGRLVEQQDVGLRQQQLGQRHAAPLAARELVDVGIARRAAQRVERLLDLRVEVPQVLRVDLVLQRRHLVGGLVGIVRRDLVEAIDDRLLLRDALHRIAKHVLRPDRAPAPAADSRRLMPSAAQASPMKSSTWPAMIFSSVDLPAPLRPTTPILAPG